MSASVRRDTVRVPFRYVLSQTLSSGGATINLSPNSGFSPRLTSLADDFDEYRITKFRFRLRRQNTVTSACALAFFPGIVDTAPSTVADLTESINHTYHAGGGESVPSPWCEVNKSVLAGMHNWYKTVVGTPESSEEVQGTMFMRGAGTDNWGVEFEGICEFRAAAAAGNTPLERALAARRREKKRIMALLAEDSPTSRAGK